MVRFKLYKSAVDREIYILNAAKGKTVLHLGCADYPFTEEQIANGAWLHSKISASAKLCVGLELDAGIVSVLQDRYKVDNIIQGDAEKLDMLLPQKFELIVAGEIIEHLNNPGLFLATASQVLAPSGMLIITTANAFCARRFFRIPLGIESVHPDHTYYFSHVTLKTLAARFGYRLIQSFSYRISNKVPFLPYLTERIFCLITPNWGEGIIHVYKLIE